MADNANTAKLREEIQKRIVATVTSKLQAGEISDARAKEIAALVLEKLPADLTYQQLMQVLPTLDDHFQELSTVIVPIMIDYEKKMRAAVETQINQLMQQGKFDQVLDVTKKAIEFEKGLS